MREVDNDIKEDSISVFILLKTELQTEARLSQ